MPAAVRIDDLNDPRVEAYRDVRDRDLRGRDRLFMAESELVVRRLLTQHPERIESLLLSPNKFERLRGAMNALPADRPVYVAELDLMSEIAGFHIHRGVLAAGVRPRPEELTLDAALGHLRGREAFTLLLAERITNVDNMGGLFRNAAAFGVDAIVLDGECCDPLYRKAIRVSMGHTLSTPWAVGEDWRGELNRLRQEWGVTLCGAEVGDEAQPLWRMPRAARLGIVIGSEGEGLRQGTRSMCDGIHEIPMAGDVPSLNVATASAVFLYERQRCGADSAGAHR